MSKGRGLKPDEKDIYIGKPHRHAVEFDETKFHGITFDSPDTATLKPRRKPKKGSSDEPPS